MTLKLKIFDSSPSTLAALNDAFADCAGVEIVRTDKVLYLHPPLGLDVLFLPLAAAERWGSKPLIHESQILPTRDDDQQNGLPRYIVTGTCLAPEDARGPIPETELLVQSALNAIRIFNKSQDGDLRVVGFWAVNLLNGVKPAELREILRREAPELC
jgi:hypothetical protein